MLRHFHTVPYAVVTPAIKLFLLLLHYCNFATVRDLNVNLYVFHWSWVTTAELFDSPEGS